MWNVEPNFELPPGFKLREGVDFLYLFYEGDLKRTFNVQFAKPADILKECERITNDHA